MIEDSCHAILGSYEKISWDFGTFGCFSMHPLKNLNIWGDGGFVVCSNYKNYKKVIKKPRSGRQKQEFNIWL